MDSIRAVIELGQAGIHTFPVNGISTQTVNGECTCGRRGCTSPGKHPLASGWQQTRKLGDTHPWAINPVLNVGVACGQISGLTVLDIDGPAGEESWAGLEEETGVKCPACPCVKTGKGRHLYFAYEPSLNNKVKIRPGIDVRNNGAFVVGPGSTHASGPAYDFESGWPMPQGESLPPIPREWLKALQPGGAQPCLIPLGSPNLEGGHRSLIPPGSPNLEGGSAVEPIMEGARNDRLFKLGCALTRSGALPDEVEAALHGVNADVCAPPLPREEVRLVAVSAGRVSAIRPSSHVLSTAELEALSSRADSPLPVFGYPGFALGGQVHLLAGHPKCGKTTLAFEMMIGWQDLRILYITADESAQTLKSRLDLFGPSRLSHVSWLVLGGPDREAVSEHASGKYDVIFVDTMRTVFGLEEENSNSGVTRELMPVVAACRAGGITAFLLHHMRKASDGTMNMRGVSGASNLTGIVDVVMLLGPSGTTGKKLRLVSEGRGLEKSEMALTKGVGRLTLGSPEARVFAALTDEDLGISEIVERSAMRGDTVLKILDLLVNQGVAHMSLHRNAETSRGVRVYSRVPGKSLPFTAVTE